jgi:PhnB protein
MISVNLIVADSQKAFEFYEAAFGAILLSGIFEADKGEKSASFEIDGDRFALADENAAYGSRSPQALGGVSFCIQLYVDDVIRVLKGAIDKGASYGMPSTQEKPVLVTGEGMQFGNVIDPFGYYWTISGK